MARNARAGRGDPEIRQALVEHLARFADRIPAFAERRARVEAGEVVELDGATLFGLLDRLGDHQNARQFNYYNDPGNARRFVLDEGDVLTELTTGGPNS